MTENNMCDNDSCDDEDLLHYQRWVAGCRIQSELCEVHERELDAIFDALLRRRE